MSWALSAVLNVFPLWRMGTKDRSRRMGGGGGEDNHGEQRSDWIVVCGYRKGLLARGEEEGLLT